MTNYNRKGIFYDLMNFLFPDKEEDDNCQKARCIGKRWGDFSDFMVIVLCPICNKENIHEGIWWCGTVKGKRECEFCQYVYMVDV